VPQGLRLPTTARPLGYRLSLEVDPAQETFHGHVVIDVELDTAAHPLSLNAENLSIVNARLLAADGSTPQALRVVPGTDHVLGLAGDQPIAAGRHQIEIEYGGVQTNRQSDGIVRREDAGDWYLVTDLEPLGARRILPCFDEPSFKVPWQLELTVPAGLVAASNTPVERDEPVADGHRRIQFAPTPPMPSYLFAFAVGPFDIVDAGATRKGVPMRLLVPHGRAADAAFMARESGTIVAALEDYTGIDFPYAKLDHVVTPGGLGGAMENAGLITYAPPYLLLPESVSADTRENALRVMAHEVAHQWFGDLVTLAWWDDLWLNEAFATWASHHVMRDLYSKYGGDSSAPTSRFIALDAEDDPSARAIRQPVVERTDIDRAFDRITYEKGATVLHMLEDTVGSDAMRTGVRAYLDRHRWSNARASDFVAAVASASGRDLDPVLGPWLDRPGAPLVSMAIACPSGQPATVELSQRRMPAAGVGETLDATMWHVPVCVRVPGEHQPRCTELSSGRGRIALGDRCPTLVVPTGRGDYRTNPSKQLRTALVRDFAKLDAAEQAAFASDTAALVEASVVDVDAMLDLLPAIGKTRNPIAIKVAAGALERYQLALPDAVRPAFQAFVGRALRRLALATGWVARPGEPYYAATARRVLVPAVAVHAVDRRLQTEVLALATRWLADHDAVPRDRWGTVLRAAITVDNGPLFEDVLSSVASESDLTALAVMASALGYTRDLGRLRRALDFVAAQDSIKPELRFVLFGPDVDEQVSARLSFLEQRLPDLLARLPADWHASIAPWTCVAEHRDRAAALLDRYFVDVADFGMHERDRWLASMDACIDARAKLSKALAAHFSSSAKRASRPAP
jgi:alanyl aminopeptidase